MPEPMTKTQLSPQSYTSHYSIQYSKISHETTLDLHIPVREPSSPSFWLIYVHGGAFRDPLVTSRAVLPAVPNIFHPHHRIAGIASLNYRLSPYPTHPTHPVTHGAKWPDHLDDVRRALQWLSSPDSNLTRWTKRSGEDNSTTDSGVSRKPAIAAGKTQWILAGHSVGATMALMMALQPWPGDGRWGSALSREEEVILSGLRGVLCLEGIYDFAACRDAHPAYREVYEAFITGAFGSEADGDWSRGNVAELVSEGAEVRSEVCKVLIVQSREDEMVEWGQAEIMLGALGRDRRVQLAEVTDGHEAIEENGVILGLYVDAIVKTISQDPKTASV